MAKKRLTYDLIQKEAVPSGHDDPLHKTIVTYSPEARMFAFAAFLGPHEDKDEAMKHLPSGRYRVVSWPATFDVEGVPDDKLPDHVRVAEGMSFPWEDWKPYVVEPAPRAETTVRKVRK